MICVPNVLTTFVTRCRYNTSVNFLAKSEFCFIIIIQLIVTVRSSAPPHNPSSVLHGVADDLSGEGSGSLNDDTRKVLKVCYSVATHNHALENDMYKCAVGKNETSAYEPSGPSGRHVSPYLPWMGC